LISDWEEEYDEIEEIKDFDKFKEKTCVVSV
jgi:hypothetical protein